MPIVGEAEIEVKPNTKGFAKLLEGGVSGALGGLGKLGVKAGAGLAAGIGVGLGAATSQFADFEAGVNEVFTLLGKDAPTQTLDAIEQNVKNLSQSFGLDLQDAIGGTYDAISAGVDPSSFESFETFTETAAKFASAGATDFGTSIDLLTTATNAFGLDSANAEQTADILFTTIKGGKTTADELAASLFQVAPIANAAGVSLEDTSAALATLTAQGVPTAAAATQLKGAFGELNKQGSKADKAFRDLAGVGFKSFLTSGGTVQEAVNLLADGADGAGISVADLFGSVEAGAAILGITGPQADRFAGNLENIADAAGATGDAFETMDQGIGASFKKIKQTFLVGLVDIGDAISPFVARVANGIQDKLPGAIEGIVGLVTGVAEKIGPVFENIADTFETLIGSFDFSKVFATFTTGDTSGVLDTLKEAFGTLLTTAKKLAPAIGTLATSLGVILGAQARVAKDVFIALVPLISQLALTILPPLADVLAIVAKGFSLVIDALPPAVLAAIVVGWVAFNKTMAATEVLLKAGGIVKYLKSTKLVAGATKLWAAAQKLLNLSLLSNPIFLAVAAIAALGVALVVAYKKSETFRNFVDKLFASFQPLVDVVKKVGAAFKDLFSGDFSGFVTGIADAFSDLGPLLLGVGSKIGGFLIDGIEAGFRTLGLGGVFDALSAGVEAAFKVVSTIVSTSFDVIVAIVKTSWTVISAAVQVGVKAVGAAIGLAKTIWDTGVLQAVFETAAAAIGVAWTVIRTVVETGIAIVGGVIDGAKAVWGAAITVLSEIFQQIGKEAGTVWAGISAVVDVGVKAVGAVLDAAVALWDTGALQAVFDAFGVAVEVVWNAIEAAIDVAIKAVGLVIAGAVAVWDTGALQAIFEGFQTVVGVVWDAINAAIDAGIQAVGLLIAGAEAVWNLGVLQVVFEAVQTAFAAAWDAITNVIIGPAVDAVGQILSGAAAIWEVGILQTIFEVFKAAIEEIWAGIETAFDLAVAAVGLIIDGAVALWDTGVLQAIFDAFAIAVGVAWDAIQLAVQVGVDLVKAVIDGALVIWNLGIIQAAFDVLAGAFTTAWDLATAAIQVGVDAIKGILGFFGIGGGGEGGGEGIGAKLGRAFDLVAAPMGVAWDGIKLVIQTAVDAIGLIFDAAKIVWEALAVPFEVVSVLIGLAWDGIKLVIQAAIDAIGLIFEGARIVWEALDAPFNVAKDLISAAWDGIKEVIGIAVDFIKENVVTKFLELKDSVLEKIDEFKTGLDEKWTAIKDAIAEFVLAIKDATVEKFLELKDEVFTKIDEFKTGADERWESIKASISAIVESLKELVKEKFNLLKTALQNTIDTLKTSLSTKWEAIKSSVSDIATALKNAVTTTFTALKDGVLEKIESLKALLQIKWDQIKSAANTVAIATKTLVTGVWQALKDFISGIFDGVSAGVPDIGGVMGALQSVYDKAISVIGAVAGALKSAIPNIPFIPSNPTVSTGGSGGGSGGGGFLAEGGLITRPELSWVGEAGKELVLPLTNSRRMRELMGMYGGDILSSLGDNGVRGFASSIIGKAASATPSGPAMGGGGDYSTNVYNYTYNGIDAERAARAQRDHEKGVVRRVRSRAR